MKDNFSGHAETYARFRPAYPEGMINYLCDLANEKKIAWDCGTGNGQTASMLAEHFAAVFATDISSNQLSHAIKKDNITYACESSSSTSLASESVNLITVSQALHWFDVEAFYQEVKRVGGDSSVIAVWAYSLLNTDQVT